MGLFETGCGHANHDKVKMYHLARVRSPCALHDQSTLLLGNSAGIMTELSLIATALKKARLFFFFHFSSCP